MRWFCLIVAAVAAVVSIPPAFDGAWAQDYHSRFMRNYPPGYHSMWYRAHRFEDIQHPDPAMREPYVWDKYMAQLTGVRYPFRPSPYAWDYGTGRTFNLPNYRDRDWH
jgi:hypothetical protein